MLKVIQKCTQGIVYILTKIVFLIFTDITFTGQENVRRVQKEGGLIFAANHTSEWDGILIRVGLPFFWSGSPIYYVSLSSNYYSRDRFGWRSHIYGGWIFRLVAAYPVYKGKRNYQIALSNFIEKLKNGGSVCIFPEGKINNNYEPSEVRGGVSYLSYVTNSVIIPVRIKGLNSLSFRKFLFKRNKITVEYLDPIYPDHLFGGRQIEIVEHKTNAKKIMDCVYYDTNCDM